MYSEGKTSWTIQREFSVRKTTTRAIYVTFEQWIKPQLTRHLLVYCNVDDAAAI